MKKLLFLLLTILCVSLARAQVGGPNNSIETFRTQIDSRDSILQEIKKPRILIDSLKSQIADYDSLTKLMDIRYADMVKVLDEYQLLTSPDTLVFHQSFSQYDIPQVLRAHIALIEKISTVRVAIEEVEKKISTLTSRLSALDVNFNQVIRKEIEPDVMKLDSMLTEIESMDLSSLSKEQREFLKPYLTERYNKFLIYFEE